jgi:nucleotide-binding universal stress UspA family protein
VLAVVDRSASGRLAARLAGQLAGSTNKLTAILDVEHDHAKDAGPQESHGLQVALDAALASKTANGSPADEPAEAPIEAAPRGKDRSVASDIAAEVAKGYDLVLFGLDGLPSENPTLLTILEAINGSYTGARAFVVSRGRNPDVQPCILLPVTGADYSRRGAELAIALAAASEVTLSVLLVSRAAARIPWYKRRTQPLPEDQATIDAIRSLAEHYGVTIRPHIRADAHPEEAIIRFARRSGANLLVMGVKERPGPGPSFGPTADTILREAPCSVVLLST